MIQDQVRLAEMPDGPQQGVIPPVSPRLPGSGMSVTRVTGLLPILFVLLRHDAPLTRAPFAPCPGRTGGWARRFFLRAQQSSQSLVDRAIVWKGVRDGGFQNDNVGRFSDPRGVLAADQGSEVRTLVLGTKLVSGLSTSLLAAAHSLLPLPSRRRARRPRAWCLRPGRSTAPL